MRNWRSVIIGSIINILCWVGGLFFIVSIGKWALSMQSQWDSSTMTVQWPLVIAAFVVAFIGHALQSQIGYVSQQYIGYPAPRAALYRTWFFSQIAKYIPGGIWQVAARSTAYTRRGIPVLLASTTTLWEIASIFAGALLVALFGAQALSDENLRVLIAVFGLLLLIGIVLSLTPLPWQILYRLGLKRADTMLRSLKTLGKARYQMFLIMTGIAVVSWLIIGAAYYLLVLAVVPAGTLPIADAMAVFLVAWIVGFLALPTPSGLGVREAVMSTLLVSYVPLPMTALIAIIARLWWVAAEGANIGIAALWQAVILYQQRTANQPEPVEQVAQATAERKEMPVRGVTLLVILILLGAGSLVTGRMMRGQWRPDPQSDQAAVAIDPQQNPVKGLDDDPVIVYCNRDQPGIDVWQRESWGINFLYSFPLTDLTKAAAQSASAHVSSSTVTLTIDGTDRYFLSYQADNSTLSNGYFGKSFTC